MSFSKYNVLLVSANPIMSQFIVFASSSSNKICNGKVLQNLKRAMERQMLNVRLVVKVRSQVISQKTKAIEVKEQISSLKWRAGHIVTPVDA